MTPSVWTEFFRAAEDPNTPEDVLDRLADIEYVYFQKVIALNPGAGARTLERLANNSEDLMKRVASNPSIPEYLRDTYARSANRDLRQIVAGNPTTSTRTLAMLANDTTLDVRIAVAGHSMVDMPTLERLAEEAEIAMWLAIASNARTPAHMLQKLLTRCYVEVERKGGIELSANLTRVGMMQERVAAHPNATAEMLSDIANRATNADVVAEEAASEATHSRDVLGNLALSLLGRVRAAVAANKNTGRDTLAMLACDDSEEVRKAVFTNVSY